MNLMQHAKSMFIVPGCKSSLLPGSHRAGLLLLPDRDGWTPPAFFSIRGMSRTARKHGLPAPATVLLMTGRAMHEVTRAHDLPLAKSGLTARRVSSQIKVATRIDMVVWTDPHTVLDGSRIGGFSPDRKIDHHYYGQHVGTAQILADKVNNLSSEKLRNALRA